MCMANKVVASIRMLHLFPLTSFPSNSFLILSYILLNATVTAINTRIFLQQFCHTRTYIGPSTYALLGSSNDSLSVSGAAIEGANSVSTLVTVHYLNDNHLLSLGQHRVGPQSALRKGRPRLCKQKWMVGSLADVTTTWIPVISQE